MTPSLLNITPELSASVTAKTGEVEARLAAVTEQSARLGAADADAAAAAIILEQYLRQLPESGT